MLLFSSSLLLEQILHNLSVVTIYLQFKALGCLTHLTYSHILGAQSRSIFRFTLITLGACPIDITLVFAILLNTTMTNYHYHPQQRLLLSRGV